MMGEDWGLFPEDGGPSLTFTSVLDIDVKSQGKVLTETVEKNGFAVYNKIEEPLEVRCTLGTKGMASDMASTLESLETLKRDCVKVTLSTPSATYDSLTLESYNYTRSAESGGYVLFVECSLREVREVETNVTTSSGVGGESGGLSKESCKNPDSASKQGTGKAGTKKTNEPEKPKRSILRDATGRGD
jgi:hypothetical protein